MKVGLIGLGQMGQAIAGRLLDTDHALVVYNRTRGVTGRFAQRGAAVAAAPVGALDADVVISMLADDAALEAVWISGGLIGELPADTVHLNMASIGLGMGRLLAERHAAAGRQYVAAPVFGRPRVAVQGQLDIVAAGAPHAVERCRPLFEALGARWYNVGAEPHQANMVKIARNFLLAALIQGLGEALALLRKTGTDPRVFLDIITESSFDRRYRDYGRRMIERSFEPTFTLSLGLKDVEVARAAGAECGVPMPTADLMREQHLAAIAAGFGDMDWAALGEFIARRAGVQD